jgi:hypothetical protein
MIDRPAMAAPSIWLPYRLTDLVGFRRPRIAK